MKPDKDLKNVGMRISNHEIKRFEQIFQHISHTRFARLIGMNPTIFRRNFNRYPNEFKLRELHILAQQFGIKDIDLFLLFEKELSTMRPIQKKGKSGVSDEVIGKARKAQYLFRTGKYNKKELAAHLEVSKPTIYKWLKIKIDNNGKD